MKFYSEHQRPASWIPANPFLQWEKLCMYTMYANIITKVVRVVRRKYELTLLDHYSFNLKQLLSKEPQNVFCILQIQSQSNHSINLVVKILQFFFLFKTQKDVVKPFLVLHNMVCLRKIPLLRKTQSFVYQWYLNHCLYFALDFFDQKRNFTIWIVLGTSFSSV